MRCTIQHRSVGRVRMRIHQSSMSLDEADRLENYIRNLKGVKQVRVDERTCNVIIKFKEEYYDDMIQSLASVHIEDLEEADLGNGREIRHHYEEIMFWHVAKHFTIKWFAPLSIKNIVSLYHAIPVIKEGLSSLVQKKKLDVHVLDASSVSFALLQNDFSTASEVMFLLKVGDIIEDWTRKKSIDDLANAMKLHVDQVWTVIDGQEVLVPVKDVRVNDVLVLRNSQLIPLDGVVVSGEAMVNQSSITGEPLPIRKTQDTPIFEIGRDV